MEKFRTGVSFPVSIANEIDEYAAKRFINRSAAIVKIYLEWKDYKAAESASPQENPTEQMKKNGAAPLPLAEA